MDHPGEKKVMLFGVNLLETVNEETMIKVKGKRKLIDMEVHDSNPSSSRSTIANEEKNKKEKKSDFEEPAPPLFDQRIVEEIEEPPVFLFEKKLTNSDVAKGLNRLLITHKDKLLQFLREGERRKLMEEKQDMAVIAKEAQLGGNQYTLLLTKWKMSKLDTIVLKHDWSKLVVDNSLKSGDSVQGWGYRRRGNDEFRLAINIIRN